MTKEKQTLEQRTGGNVWQIEKAKATVTLEVRYVPYERKSFFVIDRGYRLDSILIKLEKSKKEKTLNLTGGDLKNLLVELEGLTLNQKRVYCHKDMSDKWARYHGGAYNGDHFPYDYLSEKVSQEASKRFGERFNGQKSKRLPYWVRRGIIATPENKEKYSHPIKEKFAVDIDLPIGSLEIKPNGRIETHTEEKRAKELRSAYAQKKLNTDDVLDRLKEDPILLKYWPANEVKEELIREGRLEELAEAISLGVISQEGITKDNKLNVISLHRAGVDIVPYLKERAECRTDLALDLVSQLYREGCSLKPEELISILQKAVGSIGKDKQHATEAVQAYSSFTGPLLREYNRQRKLLGED